MDSAWYRACPQRMSAYNTVPYGTVHYRTTLPSADTSTERMQFLRKCADPRGLCVIVRLCMDYRGSCGKEVERIKYELLSLTRFSQQTNVNISTT